MSYIGSWKIGDFITFVCNTHLASTGAATDADAVPSYRIYEDETAAPVANGNMALLDAANTTGFYSERIQITAPTYTKGRHYTIYIEATVSGVTGTISHQFQIEAEVDADIDTILDADLGLHLGAGVGFRNIGNILGQLAQSEFEQRTNIFAVAPVAAQGITLAMVGAGCIQYQQVDMSYTKNFAAPDRTYYILFHYNAQQRNDIVKASLGVVW